MSDSNRTEMDKLYEWACKNESEELKNKYFPEVDKENDSYYEKRVPGQKTGYCREYTYQTVAELKKELIGMWDGDSRMQEIEKVVLVASMKNKPSEEKESRPESALETMDQLKPFIYNF